MRTLILSQNHKKANKKRKEINTPVETCIEIMKENLSRFEWQMQRKSIYQNIQSVLTLLLNFYSFFFTGKVKKMSKQNLTCLEMFLFLAEI